MLSPLLSTMGIKAIVTFHIDPSTWEIQWSLRHPPRAVITCSEHIAAQVRAVSRERGRTIPVVAIQNAIDLDRYTPGDRLLAKKHVAAAPDRPLAVMLANLAEHKGQLTSLRAIKQLKDEGLEVDCWFAGEERGEERPFTSRLQRLAAELGLVHQVRFLGFRTDGPDLLRAADFFLLPSTHEGLPLSVLEAQAAGAIVLASPLPGIREVVANEETGFLADPDDPGEYARRMKTLMERPDLRMRIATAARARVAATHNWALYVERTWQVYAAVEANRFRQEGGTWSADF
jgi:glycosyltransferase involved in cell wall biosynthesis